MKYSITGDNLQFVQSEMEPYLFLCILSSHTGIVPLRRNSGPMAHESADGLDTRRGHSVATSPRIPQRP
jgi:hypothetical protein